MGSAGGMSWGAIPKLRPRMIDLNSIIQPFRTTRRRTSKRAKTGFSSSPNFSTRGSASGSSWSSKRRPTIRRPSRHVKVWMHEKSQQPLCAHVVHSAGGLFAKALI